MRKINLYVLTQIFKSCTLIFFIFLSISWLLQLTRLFTLTNLIQIDILNVIYLSIFLIPNLLTIVIPFIVIFGILLCFIKLTRDKEIIAMYSLGLELKPIKFSLIFFSLIFIFFYSLLNLLISPIIYEKYKLKEYELRNTINLEKMIFSNFIKLNKDTIVDFKKENNLYKDIFINFNDGNDNIIFAKNGFIKNNLNKYIFQLNNGFKLSLNNNDEIEKLEFDNYVLEIDNYSKSEFNNIDKNTLTIFDDIKNKNYLNISYKFIDIIILLLIILLFYINNIKNVNLTLKNNLYFIFVTIFLLLTNQLLKNSELDIYIYVSLMVILMAVLISLTALKKKYDQN